MNLEQAIAGAVADRLAQELGGAVRDEFAALREEVQALREALQVSARPVMTLQEAAGYLGISRTKLDSLVKSGQLKSVLIGGNRRIRREWLDALTLADPGPSAKMTGALLRKASGQ